MNNVDPTFDARIRQAYDAAMKEGLWKGKYTKPATRLYGHLAGYDPSKAPAFVWPERLNAVKAQARGKKAGQKNQPD